MSLTITTNLTASIANRSLTQSNAAMERSLAKLASGSRVQSAQDDAASMAVGSRIRGELVSFKAYQQNATQVTSMLQVAEGAYQRVQDMVTRMRSLATQAQSANLSVTERGMLDTEYQQIKAEITRVANGTTFNGTSLFGTSALGFTSTANSKNTDLSGTTVGGYINSAVGDMNGDGLLDMVSMDGDTNEVRLFSGRADGSFDTNYTVLTVGNLGNTLKLADMNNDGKLDLIGTDNNFNVTRVYTNDGAGNLTLYNTTALPGDQGQINGFTIGDFDGDGRKDLAFRTSSNNVAIYRNNGDGSFTSSTFVVGTGALVGVTVGDVNNDGIDDLVAYSTTRTIRAVFGSTSGSYTMASSSYTLAGAFTVASNATLADLNGDGILDFVSGDTFSNQIAIGWGTGNGAWNTTPTLIASGGNTTDRIFVGDFNGDGYTDLVYGLTAMRMMRGNGNGTFSASAAVGLSSYAAQMVDFDRDGRMDIVGFNSVGTALLTSLNTSTLGYNGTARVSSSANSTDNIAFRIASVALNSLDLDLGYSMITNIGQAKRAENSLLRAINTLANYRTKVGAAINRLDKASDNLSTMYENQENARSAYMDLDVAAEMTVFTAKQIAVQAGISMLSQANQTQRNLIRLLGGGF